jgi:hypothetical protein
MATMSVHIISITLKGLVSDHWTKTYHLVINRRLLLSPQVLRQIPITERQVKN